jgi:hypothetical protein
MWVCKGLVEFSTISHGCTSSGYYSRRWWRIPFCPPHRIFARFCASPTSLLTSLRAHMVHRHLTSHLPEGRVTGLPSSGCAECLQRQGQPEQFLHGPASRREPRRHGGGWLPVPLGETVPASFHGRYQRHSSRFVRTHEVRVRPPPLEMEQEVRRQLRCRATAADPSRNTLSQGQLHTFEKGRLEPPAQPQPAEGGPQLLRRPTAHRLGEAHQWAPPRDLLDLTRDQPCCHLPVACPSSLALHPFPKMGCEGREVPIQPIAGEDGQAGGNELLAQRVDQGMSCVLGPWSQLQHGEDLGFGGRSPATAREHATGSAGGCAGASRWRGARGRCCKVR